MVEYKEIRNELEGKKSIAMLVILFVTIGLGASIVTEMGSNFNQNNGGKNYTSMNNSDLTKYQRNYVNCPKRYLEVCTSLSKVSTEEVVFEKVEGDRIYLDMESGRTLIAVLQSNNTAEIVSMR